jgi:hypothetical protein
VSPAGLSYLKEGVDEMSTTRKAKRARERKEHKEMKGSPFAEDGRVYYKTGKGVTVECFGIIDAIEAQESNIREQIEWPEVPTYTMTDDDVRVPHTDESIADPNTSEEEKEAWAVYKIENTEAETEFKMKLMQGRVRLLATRGVRIVDYDEWKHKWSEEHEWLGMVVPEDERERLVHFFRLEVVGSSLDDVIGIMKGIYIASGADPEVVAAGEEQFRSSLGQSEGADAETDSEETEGIKEE